MLEQALARFERKKKYATMMHELRQGQTRLHLYDDLERLKGVLNYRLREGMHDHAQFATQKEKLHKAIFETMFD